jgi:mRNA-degrading endonuclease RelE of RelBE toxin-antitoxin system
MQSSDCSAIPVKLRDVTQLVGSNAKRMRVGDFRVIFEETNDAIVVSRVGPRGEVYRSRSG